MTEAEPVTKPPRRPFRWLLVGGCAVLVIVAAIGWVVVPRWWPEQVIRHSPWVGPATVAVRQDIDRYRYDWLGRLGAWGAPALSSCLADLDSPAESWALLAADGVHKLGNGRRFGPATVARLHEVVESQQDGRVRRRVLETVVEHRLGDWPGLVRTCLHDDSGWVREVAVRALGELDDSADADFLRRFRYRRDGPSVREAAADAVARCRGDWVVDILLDYLWSGDDLLVSPAIIALDRHELNAAQKHRWVRGLVSCLRDDDVSANLRLAASRLHERRAEPLVREQLLEVIGSTDYQQRQYAAWLLRQGGAVPTRALLAATIEGFAHDRIRLANARDGFAWLLRYPDADPVLAAALQVAEDPQQRFALALVLAAHGHADSAVEVCAVLIPHLNDNNYANDATEAAAALVRLGDHARMPLLDALAEADAQGERWIGKTLERMDDLTITEHPLPQFRFWLGRGP